MTRVALDLNTEQGREKVRGKWRLGLGYVPGQPNEGLVAGIEGSPARLADYDDSTWEACENIRQSRSSGFTFGWWRIAVELPDAVDGMHVAGSSVYFETNVDNHGEIWIDGELGAGAGIIGNNVQQRVAITRNAVPGTRHVIACLAANGPLALPRGGVFMRFATLAFETTG